MNTTWDAPTRRTVAIILCIIFVFIVYISRPVLPFLIIAGLIAFILAPLVSLLSGPLRLPRGLAIALAYLLLIVTLLLTPLIIIPALLNAFADINFDMIGAVRIARTWLLEQLDLYQTLNIFGFITDLSPIFEPAREFLENLSPNLLIPSFESILSYIPSTIQITWGVASSVFGTLVSISLAILLTILYSIYLSASFQDMRTTFMNYVPPAYQPEIMELASRIQKVWNAYLRGQLTLAIIIWLLTWLVGTAIGMPGAFALGVIAGAMEVIPNLGPILAALPALLVALLQGSTQLDVSNFTFALIVLGAYFFIQQLENNVIVPKVLGDAVELSPLIVMVGVVVGFAVGGILGGLVAAPVVASGREIIAYAYAKVMMQDPYPPHPESKKGQRSVVAQLQYFWQKLSQWWHNFNERNRIKQEEKEGSRKI
jgi:predicted PurR-regulated permease PerM